MPTKPLLILALSSFAVGCSGGGITTYDDTGDIIVDAPNIVVGADVVDFGMADDVGIRISSNISIPVDETASDTHPQGAASYHATTTEHKTAHHLPAVQSCPQQHVRPE